MRRGTMDFYCIHGLPLEDQCYQCDAENQDTDGGLDLKGIGKELKKLFWMIFLAFIFIGLIYAIFTA